MHARLLSFLRLAAVVASVLVTAAVIVPAEPAVANDEVRNPAEPSYVVDLATGRQGKVWRGTESVTFRNVAADPLTEIWLRLWSNGELGCSAGSIVVSNVTGGTAGELTMRCTTLPVTLEAPVAAGATATVAMDLEIRLPHQNSRFGWYRGSAALGSALPTLAVFDDEGWHLDPYVDFGESFYSLVGDYRVTLTEPPDLDTPTTGTLESQATTPEGLEARTYVASDVRDFMWTAGHLRQRSAATASGTRVRVWFQPGMSSIDWSGRDVVVTREVADHLLAKAVVSMDAFSMNFGAYPYPEVDVVITALTQFAGMEYPEIIISIPDRYVISHELSHQWWFGIVGDDEYGEPWLDEGFATWSMYLPFGSRPWPHPWDQPWVGCSMINWPSDETRLSASMDYWREHPDEYWIAYWQGGCALAHLAKEFGFERFLDILNGYAADNWLGVATTADFQAAIEAAAIEDQLAWDPAKFWDRWRINPVTTAGGEPASSGARRGPPGDFSRSGALLP